MGDRFLSHIQNFELGCLPNPLWTEDLNCRPVDTKGTDSVFVRYCLPVSSMRRYEVTCLYAEEVGVLCDSR